MFIMILFSSNYTHDHSRFDPYSYAGTPTVLPSYHAMVFMLILTSFHVPSYTMIPPTKGARRDYVLSCSFLHYDTSY